VLASSVGLRGSQRKVSARIFELLKADPTLRGERGKEVKRAAQVLLMAIRLNDCQGCLSLSKKTPISLFRVSQQLVVIAVVLIAFLFAVIDVLRETLHVTTTTDVDAVVSRLRTKCADAGLAPPLAELVLKQTGEVLSALIEQGRRIAAVGSQMEVTRDPVGEGYSIKVIFREGIRQGLFKKLLGRLRGE
jgi:hypothetical protein